MRLDDLLLKIVCECARDKFVRASTLYRQCVQSRIEVSQPTYYRKLHLLERYGLIEVLRDRGAYYVKAKEEVCRRLGGDEQ